MSPEFALGVTVVFILGCAILAGIIVYSTWGG